MFEKIRYILHNIPDKEVEDFYGFMQEPCSKNCIPKDCISCKRGCLFNYFVFYVKTHKHKGIVNYDMTIKAYICFSFFEYMERKYNL